MMVMMIVMTKHCLCHIGNTYAVKLYIPTSFATYLIFLRYVY